MTSDLSLYIHFPWCIKKCPYCDFNSYKLTKQESNVEYIDKLKTELQQKSEFFVGKRLTSIFMGGGTPSLFSGKELSPLLQQITDSFAVSKDLEITIEINPGSREYTSIHDYLEVGINRFSVGQQSFNDQMLTKLGRIHDSTQGIKLISELSKNNLNFNIDIMYGLPGQDLDMALDDLNQALELSPKHLSWYQLTIEPNTLFAKYKPNNIPEHDKLSEFMDHGKKLISKYLYQYEISAYAKPGFICKHNYNYWSFGDYIGIGAGAHSKYTKNNTVYRSYNTRTPKDYLHKTDPTVAHTQILEKDIIFEFLMNSLRLKNGVALSLFKDRTYQQVSKLKELISKSRVDDLIQIENNKITASAKGFDFLDSCLAKIVN